MQWQTKATKIPKNFEELQSMLLQNRGITPAQTQEFLNPQHPDNFTPKSVGISQAQFTKALKMLKNALEKDQKIVLFGDYDVDGICASSILWQVLFELYKKKWPSGLNHPIPFIPDRKRHGYGISNVALDEVMSAHSPELLVTLDNGVVAHAAVAYAKTLGLSVIITDHHQPELKNEKIHFPEADCVVHTTQLCGATVGWMLAKELLPEKAAGLLELAGIATIADQVPLTQANRSFAFFGLRALKKTKHIGLLALFKEAQIKQAEITEWTVGFGIAPRINAIGRLSQAIDAVRLLCTGNKTQAQQLAVQLQETNTQRQELTKKMVAEAVIQAEKMQDEHLNIVYSSEFHEGVIGLIASGLVEAFHKPAIVIHIDATIAKASVRSVYGVNIVELLRTIQDELLSVGGHPMAAGFSFLPEKLEKIMQLLFERAKKSIDPKSLQKTVLVDCQLPVSLLTPQTIDGLQVLAPFGMKNPQPVFELRDLLVLEVKLLGKNKEHFKVKVSALHEGTTSTFDCLGWSKAAEYSQVTKNMRVNIVGTIENNQWQEKKYPQVILKALSVV